MGVTLLPDAAPEGREQSPQDPLVLIVEDNSADARPLRDILETAGYRTQLAGDAMDALRLVLEIQPDLVLTDIRLPGMDGLALTRQLKNDPATAAIPVVALSSRANDKDRQLALANGCTGFIARPYRYRTFLSEVADAIE
jgi:two-component system cell cycle response regulator DivK